MGEERDEGVPRRPGVCPTNTAAFPTLGKVALKLSAPPYRLTLHFQMLIEVAKARELPRELRAARRSWRPPRREIAASEQVGFGDHRGPHRPVLIGSLRPRKLLVVPADSGESSKLARHYSNASLGDIAVNTSGPSTIFDFGEWKSEVASRKNPDGTISFITTEPGVSGGEFVVGPGPKRTLIVRDAQHEYIFEER